MARSIHRLSARGVQTLPKGKHGDGGNLFLRVDASGARRWSFIYAVPGTGRERELGLGSLRDVSLAQARQKASSYRALLAQGQDPGLVREVAAVEAVPTFSAFATSLLGTIESEWRNAKHRDQWQRSLATYVYPIIGDLKVDEIATADILRVLKPIWVSKQETAKRVRGRVERILSAARAAGHIPESRSNPATWRGHLDQLLPARQSLSQDHHAALAYSELPDFMRKLEGYDGVAGRALAFTILTAARTGETLGARWSEIDLETRVWVIPAGRMKAGRIHRVPLSVSAEEVLRSMERLRQQDDGYVFPGMRPGKPLSGMSLFRVMGRLGCAATTHGFRSTFRDWCAEQTSAPPDLAELCLAHTVGSKVSRAYRRSDLLEQRRVVMESWSRFISGDGAEVIALRPAAAG